MLPIVLLAKGSGHHTDWSNPLDVALAVLTLLFIASVIVVSLLRRRRRRR